MTALRLARLFQECTSQAWTPSQRGHKIQVFGTLSARIGLGAETESSDGKFLHWWKRWRRNWILSMLLVLGEIIDLYRASSIVKKVRETHREFMRWEPKFFSQRSSSLPTPWLYHPSKSFLLDVFWQRNILTCCASRDLNLAHATGIPTFVA